MKKIEFARYVSIAIIICNIFNYFFMAASYGGVYLKQSASFFENTFINYEPFERGLGYHTLFTGSASLPFILFPIVDAVILFFLLKKTKNYLIYSDIPYVKLFTSLGIAIILHILAFNVCNCTAQGEVVFILEIRHAMFINVIYIVGYFIIIYLFINVKNKRYTNESLMKIKIDLLQIISLSIIIELILSFFYTSIVCNLRVWINPDPIYEIEPHFRKYGKFFFSPFEMTYKHGNPYGFEGKNESYPYMWVLLFCYIIMPLLSFLKIKKSELINIVLTSICIIIMIVSVIDMGNSIYVNYVRKGANFFQIAGEGFYAILFLQSLFILINVLQIQKKKIIVVETINEEEEQIDEGEYETSSQE